MFEEILDKSVFDNALSCAQEYLETIFERNVFPTEEALKNLSFFDEDMPAEPSESKELINTLHKYGSPATVAQVGGRYFGFVNGSVVPAALAAKNLSIYWDQNCGMQVISPISSKLETIVENWLKKLFNLPDRTAEGFVSGTSMATFCGLAAARYRLLKNQNWDINEKGLFNAPMLRIVTSKQAH